MNHKFLLFFTLSFIIPLQAMDKKKSSISAKEVVTLSPNAQARLQVLDTDTDSGNLKTGALAFMSIVGYGSAALSDKPLVQIIGSILGAKCGKEAVYSHIGTQKLQGERQAILKHGEIPVAQVQQTPFDVQVSERSKAQWQRTIYGGASTVLAGSLVVTAGRNPVWNALASSGATLLADASFEAHQESNNSGL